MAESKKAKNAKKSSARRVLDASLPVFQLTITLEDSEPAIWRRIETHDCSLADFHEIIQSCMGWEDEHMHAFEIGDEQYTDFSRGVDPYEFQDSRSVRLSRLVEQGQYRFVYEYDFGDCWRHAIEIENTVPAEENTRYPRCIDGRRACPPEDCGGVYGYGELLGALANHDDDNEEYDERLEWLGDDFDPERFSADRVNRELLRLRQWMGRQPVPHGQPARFAVGDRVRAKPGVVHCEYPDIPLSGWAGAITKIAWLIPIAYRIRWTEDTLADAHPVYHKRCRRDDVKPGTHWLDEGEIEPDSAEQPIPMEQPTNLIARPLAPDDQDDRIRVALGLTGDDPLPAWSDETDHRYLDHLKAHLAFPFDAMYWSELTPHSHAQRRVEVVGFASPSPVDIARGVLCEVRDQQQSRQVPLADLEVDETDANCQYVDDYRYWLFDTQEAAGYDEEEEDDDAYWDDADEDDEEDREDDEEDREDDEEDYEYGEEDFGPRLAGDLDGLNDGSHPEPIRRGQPQVGRNDPCPCGSGKKFKKCCFKKQDNQ